MTQILYGKDYYAWVNQQTELLKKGEIEHSDWNNIVEEFSSLAWQEERKFEENLQLLIGHLLIWQWHHPTKEQAKHNLHIEIYYRRRHVLDILEDSPSLETRFLKDPEWLRESWEYGRLKFGIITDADKSVCPKIPIWSAEQILNYDFYPEIKQYG